MNAPIPSRIRDALEQAIRDFETGRHPAAESACRALLTEHPDLVDALNLLGAIAGGAGRYDEAADCFRRALAHAAPTANTLANLANALQLQGRSDEAVPLLREALAIARPDAAAGLALKLATLLRGAGQTDAALAACRDGLRAAPEHPDLNGLAADLLMQRRELPGATAHLLAAIRAAPGDDRHWERLHRLLRIGTLPPAQGRQWLLRALAHPVIPPLEIAGSVARTLCREDRIAALARDAGAGTLPHGAALAEQVTRLSADPLLLALMKSTHVPHDTLSQLFTGLRRALLVEADSGAFGADTPPFCAALAIQAFLTDYAWDLDDDELARVDALARDIGAMLREDRAAAPPAHALALLAMYRPLHELAGAESLAAHAWPVPVADLIRVQVTEPRAEQADRALIPSLTGISDPVSLQVRAQYEEHPYPRWVRTGRATTPSTLPDMIRALGGEAPPDASFARPEILIAGCGTGQHPLIAASFYRDARILAVDISRASLAYARRKTRESGLDGIIEYRQGDILELGALEQRFHVVESIGVLHHLRDPLAGWRVLTGLLRPGGVMRIGLYSELARRAIVLGREHIAARGYAATAGDIRRFRREILALPDDHPLAALRRLRDFYNLGECRDLLFHVQEHRFTIPRIRAALDTLGLRFLGFKLRDQGDYRDCFPDDPRMTSLARWHEVEQERPDTFREMYNFIVQKPP